MMAKYKEVENYIIERIESGYYKDGQRLPSCRQLSNDLKLNKITINKAYNALENKHYVYSVPRGGFYVIGIKEPRENRRMDVDYTVVKPEEKMIPFRAFTHAMNNAIELHKVKLFDESNSQGLEALRSTLSERVASDGIYSSMENMVITHGSQQGIDLTLQLLFKDQKKKILIEAPTYSLAIARINSLGIDTETIDRTEEGLSLERLEAYFKTDEIKCFYIIPRYHNPTGYSLNETQKKAIASLANRYDVWIIEDDYLGDLGKSGEGLPIHYYDIGQRVIYLRSFSKTFMPGIRIGAMCCPESIVQNVVKLKKITDLGTSILTQSALNIFIQSGMYDQHISKIRKLYKQKLELATRLLDVGSASILNYYIPQTGIFIWLRIKDSCDIEASIEALRKEGIFLKTSESFYYENKGHRHIRLCISSIPEKELYTLSRMLKVF